MEPINEKLRVEEELAVAQKALKDMLGDLDIAKKEKIALESWKVKNEQLIEEQTAKLRETINDIATQKIEWAQEKAAEERELEAKKKTVEAILSRSATLDVQEGDIGAKVIADNEILAKNSQVLLETEQIKTLIEVGKREIEAEKEGIVAHRAEIDKKIDSFKISVIKVVNELAQI